MLPRLRQWLRRTDLKFWAAALALGLAILAVLRFMR